MRERLKSLPPIVVLIAEALVAVVLLCGVFAVLIGSKDAAIMRGFPYQHLYARQ